jgi:FKBP-type peptidyl-prolyl cis-trans isomerase
VSDLSPLKELPLIKYLNCDFKAEGDAKILHSIKTLKTINGKAAQDFLKEVDAKSDRPSDAAPPGEVTKPSGLKYIDLKVGTGKEAKAGDTVIVHYTGWLKDGKKFDSSVDRNAPFTFELGGKGRFKVIKGWDEGVAGMKAGGKRKLIIPPNLAYGSASFLAIPANAELHFEIELLEVK